jgi:SAM-dependent methyltransferase
MDAEKIPWHEPEFSRRMLREHLSQAHDAASRRAERIDAHVEWIHAAVLGGQPARVLDLGCGPGLYTSRLAARGHRCLGVDFSPASIDYAKREVERERLACDYRLQDLRDGNFGRGFDLALLLFGEFNAFRRADATRLLSAAADALGDGGTLILEVHDSTLVQALGTTAPTWHAADSGLFSDAPYLCLKESAWSDAERASVERWIVIDVATAEVSVFASNLQTYSDREYRDALLAAGLVDIETHGPLGGAAPANAEGLFALTAGKPAAR